MERKESLVGLDHKKSIKNPFSLVLSSLQYTHLLAAKTFTSWDGRHLPVCLDPSFPTSPHLHTHHRFGLLATHPPLSAPQLKPNPKARCCGLSGKEQEKGVDR